MTRSLVLAALLTTALITLGPAPASARVVTQTLLVDTASDHVVEVRRGGKGWAKGNRGRHYGWSRGRGNAWGRKRRFGF